MDLIKKKGRIEETYWTRGRENGTKTNKIQIFKQIEFIIRTNMNLLNPSIQL